MEKKDRFQFNLKYVGKNAAGEIICTSLYGKIKVKFSANAWDLLLKASQSDIDESAVQAAKFEAAKPKRNLREVKKDANEVKSSKKVPLGK